MKKLLLILALILIPKITHAQVAIQIDGLLLPGNVVCNPASQVPVGSGWLNQVVKNGSLVGGTQTLGFPGTCEHPTTYDLDSYSPVQGDVFDVVNDVDNVIYFSQWVWEGGQPVNTATSTTRFFNIYLSTTTQTVRFTGYISPDDVDVKLGFNVSTPVYAQWDNEQLTATTTGLFDQSFHYQNFSTSTIDIFTFTGTLYKRNPDYDFNGTNGDLNFVIDEISTTTTASGLGVTHLPTPAEVDEAIAENCNPFGSFFSIGRCVSYLVFPNVHQVDANISLIRDSFLTKAPVGYITRFVSILASSATTTIPNISYTWANDGGPLATKTWTIEVDDYMAQASTLSNEMVSNTDGKTAWEILGTLINTFLAIVVLFAILHDIMGIKLHNNK